MSNRLKSTTVFILHTEKDEPQENYGSTEIPYGLNILRSNESPDDLNNLRSNGFAPPSVRFV